MGRKHHQVEESSSSSSSLSEDISSEDYDSELGNFLNKEGEPYVVQMVSMVNTFARRHFTKIGKVDEKDNKWVGAQWTEEGDDPAKFGYTEGQALPRANLYDAKTFLALKPEAGPLMVELVDMMVRPPKRTSVKSLGKARARESARLKAAKEFCAKAAKNRGEIMKKKREEREEARKKVLKDAISEFIPPAQQD